MRRRFLLTMLMVTLAMLGVLLAGIGAIYLFMSQVQASGQDRVQDRLSEVSGVLQQRWASGGVVDEPLLRSIIGPDERIGVATSLRLPVVVDTGAGIQGFTASLQLDNGDLIRVSQSSAPSDRQLFLGFGAVLALGLLVAGIGILVVDRQMRRVVVPLEELVRTAEQLGSGDARPGGRRYGVPELDRVAEVLDEGVTRTNVLLERERHIVSEVSHQLRTPLTAVSLRLEEILAAADQPGAVRAEATAALEQVERLGDAVGELVLMRRDSPGPREPVPLDVLVSESLQEMAPAFTAAGRTLARAGESGLLALATPGAQRQVLATLLDNALRHGRGGVVVRTRSSGDWVVLEVQDDGPGVALGLQVFDRGVSGRNGSGIGLALARTLVEGDRGRIEVRRGAPTVFAVYLPSGSGTGTVQGSGTDDARPQDRGGRADQRAALPTSRRATPGSMTSAGNTQRL